MSIRMESFGVQRWRSISPSKIFQTSQQCKLVNWCNLVQTVTCVCLCIQKSCPYLPPPPLLIRTHYAALVNSLHTYFLTQVSAQKTLLLCAGCLKPVCLRKKLAEAPFHPNPLPSSNKLSFHLGSVFIKASSSFASWRRFPLR